MTISAPQVDERLPPHIAVWVQLSLALWAWVCIAGAATLLARILGGS